MFCSVRIKEGRKKGMLCVLVFRGRKEGRKEGREEGRKEGREE